jgi:hypothetical protein
MAFNFADDKIALGLALNTAYSASYISSLGRPALMLTVSLDPRSAWSNGILENSRYARFSIDSDGTIEHFSGSLPKFRKCKVADIETAAAKINAWAAKHAQ